MDKIESLAALYAEHISAPWHRTLAGAQRVLIVVYAKEQERSLRARRDEFAQGTRDAHHGWTEFDVTGLFAEWMVNSDYPESYFDFPEGLGLKLEESTSEFPRFVAERLRAVLKQNDENTVVALTGVASLFGFARVSNLIQDCERDIRGRLVVFFPGTRDGNNYRLLDARDGWNYHAPSISIHGSGVSA